MLNSYIFSRVWQWIEQHRTWITTYYTTASTMATASMRTLFNSDNKPLGLNHRSRCVFGFRSLSRGFEWVLLLSQHISSVYFLNSFDVTQAWWNVNALTDIQLCLSLFAWSICLELWNFNAFEMQTEMTADMIKWAHLQNTHIPIDNAPENIRFVAVEEMALTHKKHFLVATF